MCYHDVKEEELPEKENVEKNVHLVRVGEGKLVGVCMHTLKLYFSVTLAF